MSERHRAKKEKGNEKKKEMKQKKILTTITRPRLPSLLSMPGMLVLVLVVLALLAGLVYTTLSVSGKKTRDAQRIADIQTIAKGLQTYHGHTKAFPARLSLLAPNYIGAVPTDPLGPAYFYAAYATSTKACLAGHALGYHLGAALEAPALVAGDANAPVPPPAGEVTCAGDTANHVSAQGFDGASDKCLSLSSVSKDGDTCYDVSNQ